MRQPARRWRPSSRRRLTLSRSPASQRKARPPRCGQVWAMRLTPLFEETVSVLGPSIDSIKGPFERVATPNEAVDRLVRRYGEATQALHEAGDRFLKQGEPPSAATRALFRYPGLRPSYAPNGPALSSARAFAKFSEAGLYTTT